MRARLLPGLTLLALTCALSSAPLLAAITTQQDLERVADLFYASTAIDDSRVFDVQNLTITKDIATFTLKTGTIYLTKPHEGLTVSAVFIGNGRVTINPKRPLDRRCLDLAADQHLKKKPGGRIDAPLTELFLVTPDGTLGGIEASLKTKATAPDVPRAARILADRLDVLKAQEIGFDLDIVEKIAGLDLGPLYIDFNTKEYGWLVYAFAPRGTVSPQFEVMLATRERVGMFYDSHPLIMTHQLSDLDEAGNYIANPVSDVSALLDVKHYEMMITIPDTKSFQVEVAITLAPLVDNLSVLDFDLVNNIAGAKSTEKAKPIHVRKVADSAGTALPFLHRKNALIVIPGAPLKRDQDFTIHVSLDEETITQLSSVHYLVLNTYPWFPQHGYNGGHYTMDWTIKAKKPLIATGSGKLIEEVSEAGFNVTRLRFEKEVQFPSLIFGEYRKHTAVYERKPGDAAVQLAVYSSPTAQYMIDDADVVRALTSGRQSSPLPYDLDVPGSKPASVLAEAQQIIKMFEGLFGPFPYDTLNVAQMAPFMGFGQAPPGLVQLTGEAFMNPAAEVRAGDYYLNFNALKLDFFHEFFAHEVAHQWFGHSIVWGTDEDVWLSEAFAEYAAGLYVMQYLGPDKFQEKLKTWKDNARAADPYAPIAWAVNLSGQGPAPQRTKLIYDKGPYVVHMLRMQMGHDNFVKALRGAITKFSHKPITTDDLRMEFEAVAGYKLDYFFNQWYQDIGIPMFDYWTKVEPTDDGKWLATVKTRQRDKEKAKVVSLPVFFHFGKDKVVVKNRPVLQAEDVYQIKLPEKPQKITLDDFKTLLADFVDQGELGS